MRLIKQFNMKQIRLDGDLVFARRYDEVAGWAEVPYVDVYNGCFYCPLTMDFNPIFTIIEGEVYDGDDSVDSEAIVNWIIIGAIFWCAMYLLSLAIKFNEGNW